MSRSGARGLLAAGAAAAVLTGCGGAAETGGARQVAERFYAAVGAEDGAAACEQLSVTAREQLEQDERKPCPEAVVGLDLSGARAVRTARYVTNAKVDLDGGDSVFLQEAPDGWRISAAGCRPAPGQEAPYDCDVES